MALNRQRFYGEQVGTKTAIYQAANTLALAFCSTMLVIAVVVVTLAIIEHLMMKIVWISGYIFSWEGGNVITCCRQRFRTIFHGANTCQSQTKPLFSHLATEPTVYYYYSVSSNNSQGREFLSFSTVLVLLDSE